MSDEYLRVVGADVRSWARPTPANLPEPLRERYQARCDALMGLVEGMSLRAAAYRFGVDSRTIRADAVKCQRRDADDQLIGFRACIPYAERITRELPGNALASAPRKGPHVMSRLVETEPDFSKLVMGYKGQLPKKGRRCSAFNAHHKAVCAYLLARWGPEAYPFDTDDHGRAGLLTLHRRIRARRLQVGAAEVEATASTISTFRDLFVMRPLDRLEFDEHRTDVDWCINVTLPDGSTTTRRFVHVTLQLLICAVSRYIVAYRLILGDANQLDTLWLMRGAMAPWKPRELVVPNLSYCPGARLGLPHDENGAALRALLLAGDNAFCHFARHVGNNAAHLHGGILNLGRAHSPEARGIIEAAFRRLEEGALRDIAGGFQPSTVLGGTATATSTLRAEDHPLQWMGLEDLFDVLCANHNATPHSSIGNQLPLQRLDVHRRDPWRCEVPDGALTAERMLIVTLPMTIRGSEGKRKQPYIRYLHATYRSPKLRDHWSYLGKKVKVDVNLGDLRHLTVLDERGSALVRLAALPPWNKTVHDIVLRRLIARADKRQLVRINGSNDAIASWHAYARQQVSRAPRPETLLRHLPDFSPAPPIASSAAVPHVAPQAPLSIASPALVDFFGEEND
ncbi:hypothetical protein DFR29_121110 [Tahibacter aquaticus]|uniref:Transposase n=1 Tax=Tahibacter aquaticus TaxID=520092 RepID=A0A4R6YMD0_9GAMM|nr:hypothetical protein [Tahibacter aquaticus]TDR38438.1 hypothetical protein DFR29_121110 [Tahibacter aquaticus]